MPSPRKTSPSPRRKSAASAAKERSIRLVREVRLARPSFPDGLALFAKGRLGFLPVCAFHDRRLQLQVVALNVIEAGLERTRQELLGAQCRGACIGHVRRDDVVEL